MSLFCLLSLPAFFLFRASFRDSDDDRSGIELAVILGAVAALLRSWVGDLVPSDSFGFLSWLHFLMDRAALPVVLAIVAWIVLKNVRGSRMAISAEDFCLVWLIIPAIFFTLRSSSLPMAMELLLVPIVWISLSLAMPLFLTAAQESFGIAGIGAWAALVLMPIVASTSLWAFYSQHFLLAWLLLAVTVAPAAVCMGKDVLSGLKK